jgi:hypothetical protein
MNMMMQQQLQQQQPVSNNNPLQHLPTWLKRVIMLPNQDYWNYLDGTTTSTISNSESQQHAATPAAPEVEVVLEKPTGTAI